MRPVRRSLDVNSGRDHSNALILHPTGGIRLSPEAAASRFYIAGCAGHMIINLRFSTSYTTKTYHTFTVFGLACLSCWASVGPV